VHRGNEDIWTLIRLINRQWKVRGMDGTPYALNLAEFRETARDLGFKCDSRFYEKLNIWEVEALKVMGEGNSTTETDEEYLASMEKAATSLSKGNNGQSGQ